MVAVLMAYSAKGKPPPTSPVPAVWQYLTLMPRICPRLRPEADVWLTRNPSFLASSRRLCFAFGNLEPARDLMRHPTFKKQRQNLICIDHLPSAHRITSKTF